MGYLRFILALAVVHGHLVAYAIYWQQRVAVNTFFILSGFLITSVVNQFYGSSIRGKLYFLFNRMLRIYPCYLTCLIVCSVCIWLEPNAAKQLLWTQRLPVSLSSWWPQINIVGQAGWITPSINSITILPTAWSLGVELVFYCILGLLTAFSRRLTVACLMISVLGVGWAYISHVPHATIFRSILGSAPIFFLGSVMYHYRDAVEVYSIKNLKLILILSVAFLVLPDVFSFYKTYNNWKLPYQHFSSILFVWLIVSIYHLERYNKISVMERWCADLAYPIFLLHMGIASLIKGLFNMSPRVGYEIFVPSLLVTFLVSIVVVTIVETPLKNVRQKIRHRAIMSGQ